VRDCHVQSGGSGKQGHGLARVMGENGGGVKERGLPRKR
jgi:hypothetical protein